MLSIDSPSINHVVLCAASCRRLVGYPKFLAMHTDHTLMGGAYRVLVSLCFFFLARLMFSLSLDVGNTTNILIKSW